MGDLPTRGRALPVPDPGRGQRGQHPYLCWSQEGRASLPSHPGMAPACQGCSGTCWAPQHTHPPPTGTALGPLSPLVPSKQAPQAGPGPRRPLHRAHPCITEKVPRAVTVTALGQVPGHIYACYSVSASLTFPQGPHVRCCWDPHPLKPAGPSIRGVQGLSSTHLAAQSKHSMPQATGRIFLPKHLPVEQCKTLFLKQLAFTQLASY